MDPALHPGVPFAPEAYLPLLTPYPVGYPTPTHRTQACHAQQEQHSSSTHIRNPRCAHNSSILLSCTPRTPPRPVPTLLLSCSSIVPIRLSVPTPIHRYTAEWERERCTAHTPSSSAPALRQRTQAVPADERAYPFVRACALRIPIARRGATDRNKGEKRKRDWKGNAPASYHRAPSSTACPMHIQPPEQLLQSIERSIAFADEGATWAAPAVVWSTFRNGAALCMG
ncbi:hypothetical protein B0H13DRAFT_2278284 [Mycena leptocephala]|nr:hypothetical protein B0H13DRAFT_2278284 [Mycena leptocephala]